MHSCFRRLLIAIPFPLTVIGVRVALFSTEGAANAVEAAASAAIAVKVFMFEGCGVCWDFGGLG